MQTKTISDAAKVNPDGADHEHQSRPVSLKKFGVQSSTIVQGVRRGRTGSLVDSREELDHNVDAWNQLAEASPILGGHLSRLHTWFPSKLTHRNLFSPRVQHDDHSSRGGLEESTCPPKSQASARQPKQKEQAPLVSTPVTTRSSRESPSSHTSKPPLSAKRSRSSPSPSSYIKKPYNVFTEDPLKTTKLRPRKKRINYSKYCREGPLIQGGKRRITQPELRRAFDPQAPNEAKLPQRRARSSLANSQPPRPDTHVSGSDSESAASTKNIGSEAPARDQTELSTDSDIPLAQLYNPPDRVASSTPIRVATAPISQNLEIISLDSTPEKDFTDLPTQSRHFENQERATTVDEGRRNARTKLQTSEKENEVLAVDDPVQPSIQIKREPLAALSRSKTVLLTTLSCEPNRAPIYVTLDRLSGHQQFFNILFQERSIRPEVTEKISMVSVKFLYKGGKVGGWRRGIRKDNLADWDGLMSKIRVAWDIDHELFDELEIQTVIHVDGLD